MMDGVGRPKPSNAVAAAMEPVVAEILADKERDHYDRRIYRYREETVIVSEIPHRYSEAERKQRHYDVLAPKSIGQRCEIRTPIVVASHHNGENQPLEGRNHHHDRQRKSEDAGHVPFLRSCVMPRPLVGEG